eukprot:comp21708_c0_seq1/m.48309 comp21708_c0_seq1/g.48309  ORF comp21708_c0_seq1/g.48309 comp21708_c0_seq1/m.48309 type:complete len:382 (-) comp21708_c0_seq1:602-1747(-)
MFWYTWSTSARIPARSPSRFAAAARRSASSCRNRPFTYAANSASFWSRACFSRSNRVATSSSRRTRSSRSACSCRSKSATIMSMRFTSKPCRSSSPFFMSPVARITVLFMSPETSRSWSAVSERTASMLSLTPRDTFSTLEFTRFTISVTVMMSSSSRCAVLCVVRSAASSPLIDRSVVSRNLLLFSSLMSMAFCSLRNSSDARIAFDRSSSRSVSAVSRCSRTDSSSREMSLSSCLALRLSTKSIFCTISSAARNRCARSDVRSLSPRCHLSSSCTWLPSSFRCRVTSDSCDTRSRSIRSRRWSTVRVRASTVSLTSRDDTSKRRSSSFSRVLWFSASNTGGIASGGSNCGATLLPLVLLLPPLLLKLPEPPAAPAAAPG